jgi:hypothetical protein
VASSANPVDDSAFNELCRLLRVSPQHRTLAGCLEIGRLIDSFFSSDGPDELTRKDIYRQRIAVDLVERLRKNRINFTTSTAYGYRRFFNHRDKRFLKACRKATQARWEDVMRLLNMDDSALRLELLAVAENREPGDKLSARAFKELVRLAVLRGAMPGKSIAKIGHPTPVAAARRLRSAAARADAAVAAWLDGPSPLADRLGNDRSLGPAAAGEARAALRLFRAAARRLGKALKPVTSSTARRSTARSKPRR